MVGVSVWAWIDRYWFRNTDNPQNPNIFKYYYAHTQITMFLLCCYLLWFWKILWSLFDGRCFFLVFNWQYSVQEITPGNSTFSNNVRALANNLFFLCCYLLWFWSLSWSKTIPVNCVSLWHTFIRCTSLPLPKVQVHFVVLYYCRIPLWKPSLGPKKLP